MPTIDPPKDWVPPPHTIIIAASPRSGSTIFADRLLVTDALGRPAEFFNPAHFSSPVSVSDMCREAVVSGATPNGVVAIKLFPDHFGRLKDSIRFTAWFPNPTWVYLERRDKLAQAISLTIARQTASWTSSEPRQAVPYYSNEEIDWSLDDILNDEQRWKRFFSRAAISPLHFIYEDELPDFSKACLTIAEHLGIESLASSRPASVFEVQGDATNRDWKERFLAEAVNVDDFDLIEGLTRPV